jgi:hypothetical protein
MYVPRKVITAIVPTSGTCRIKAPAATTAALKTPSRVNPTK